MRHNLTNIAETQLDKVDSFYVVGSTTREGIIEGKSNVKIDLKKAVAEGGSDGGGASKFNIYDIVLADDLLAKMESLTFEGSGKKRFAVTDWSFEDICTQDSEGMLQSAFEGQSGILLDHSAAAAPSSTEDAANAANGAEHLIVTSNYDLMYDPEPEALLLLQDIVFGEVDGFTWDIFYDKEEGKYIVRRTSNQA